MALIFCANFILVCYRCTLAFVAFDLGFHY